MDFGPAELEVRAASWANSAREALKGCNLDHLCSVLDIWNNRRVQFKADTKLLENLQSIVAAADNTRTKALELLVSVQNQAEDVEARSVSLFTEMRIFVADYKQDPGRAIVVPEAEEIAIVVHEADDWLERAQASVVAPTSVFGMERLQEQAHTLPPALCLDQHISSARRYSA